MAKDELWHIYLFLLMHDHWDSFSVVPYLHTSFCLIYPDFNLGCPSLVSLNVICRVDDDFVEYFIEARDE
jgi:hypothetical protein